MARTQRKVRMEREERPMRTPKKTDRYMVETEGKAEVIYLADHANRRRR